MKRMNRNAIRKYFIDVNTFNIPLTLIIGFIEGILWGLITFCSIGVIVGLIGYQYFKKNEYYTYYNIGLTKKKLIKSVWLFNLIISVVLILTYILFNTWIH